MWLLPNEMHDKNKAHIRLEDFTQKKREISL